MIKIIKQFEPFEVTYGEVYGVYLGGSLGGGLYLAAIVGYDDYITHRYAGEVVHDEVEYVAEIRVPVAPSPQDLDRLEVIWPEAQMQHSAKQEEARTLATIQKVWRLLEEQSLGVEEFSPKMRKRFTQIIREAVKKIEPELPTQPELNVIAAEKRNTLLSRLDAVEELLDVWRFVVETERKYILNNDEVLSGPDREGRILKRSLEERLELAASEEHLNEELVAAMIQPAHPVYRYAGWGRRVLADNPYVAEEVLIALMADSAQGTAANARRNAQARQHASSQLLLAAQLTEAGNYTGDPDGLIEALNAVLSDE